MTLNTTYQHRNQNFALWLWKKLYLSIIALYASIGIVMLLPTWCTETLQLPRPLALFVSFFIISYARVLYESMLLYETKFSKKQLLIKSLQFALINGGCMTVLVFLIKPVLGYFAIPLSIVLSSLAVKTLKSILFPSKENVGFLVELPNKISLMMSHTYRFYLIFVGLALLAVKAYAVNFFLAFTGAFFIAMLIEEITNIQELYQYTLTMKIVTLTIFWSILCAVGTGSLVWLFMQQLCYPGPLATILSVIAIKLLQPLGKRLVM